MKRQYALSRYHTAEVRNRHAAKLGNGAEGRKLSHRPSLRTPFASNRIVLVGGPLNGGVLKVEDALGMPDRIGLSVRGSNVVWYHRDAVTARYLFSHLEVQDNCD